MESDAPIQRLCAGAKFPTDELRRFRGQNSELLKLTLAFALRHAWEERFGRKDITVHGTAVLREILLAEATSRLQRAIFEDPMMVTHSSNRTSRREEALINYESRLPGFEVEVSLVTSSATGYGLAVAVIVLLALLMFLIPARAGETLPPFKLDGRTITNAVVLEANPVDVLIRQDELGYKRLKRQEMPAELKDRFPYNAQEVEEYGKQKLAKARVQREQQRSEIYATLKRREQAMEVRIAQRTEDLVRLQKEINIWRGRPRGRGKVPALNELQQRKADVTKEIDVLRDQLKTLQAQLSLYL